MVSRHVEVELRDVPFSHPSSTVAKVPRLVSPRVGLIQRLHSSNVHAQDPTFLSMAVSCADLFRITNIRNSPKAGGGGEDVETAIAATVGEMVERYCMYWYDDAEFIQGTYTDVRDDATHPDILRLYSEDQVRRKPSGVELEYFGEGTRIDWVWAYSLTRRVPVLVPASFVYMNYETVRDGVVNIGRQASTGLAAGVTLEEAVLSGLTEVIERDAFTVCWLHRKVRAAVTVDDAALAADLTRRFRTDNPSVSLRFYDITLDIRVPCIFGTLVRPAEFGRVLCVSSVARTNPYAAIVKCAREIGQGMPYLRYLRAQLKDWTPAEDYSDVRTFDHHFVLYSKRPGLIDRNMTFCDEAPVTGLSALPDISTGRPLGDIENLVRMLADLKYEVIVRDITTPDVSDVGLRVVRVLVPGLVPLHGNYNFPYLGVRRLYDVPERLRWADAGWNPDTGLNRDPHPFP